MLSSIFNFEHWRRYAALPRREQAAHLLLALLLALTLPLGCRALIKIYGQYGARRVTALSAGVAALSSETQVLGVGTSHVLGGIWPERYSARVMNIAAPALTYGCAEAAVQRHLPRLHGVRLAVVELDEVMTKNNMVTALDTDLRPLLQLGLSPLEIPATSFRQRANVLLWGTWYPFFTMPRLTPYDLVNRRAEARETKETAGFTPYEGSIRNDHDPGKRLRRLQQNVQQDMRPEQAALLRLVALLRRHHVRVILLHFPHHASYFSDRPRFFGQRYDQLNSAVTKQFGGDGGVEIWDWGKQKSFTDNDFHDCDHLNTSGAAKLARLLDPKINALLARK